MNPRVRVAGICLNEEGNILMIKHQKNGNCYWLLPGGGVDYGETMTTALSREFLEETGLTIEVEKFISVSESISPDKERHIIHMMFEVKRECGSLILGDEERLCDLKFLSIDELLACTMYPSLQQELVQFINDKKIQPQYLGSRWDK